MTDMEKFLSSKQIGHAIKVYCRSIAEVYATGQATEHSYRRALMELLDAVATNSVGSVTIVNEPARVAAGAPDLAIVQSKVTIGHIECKTLGSDLEKASHTSQLKRYRDGLPNLMLATPLNFKWYVRGQLQKDVRLGGMTAVGDIEIDPAAKRPLARLLIQFLAQSVPVVDSSYELARQLAMKARLLKEAVERILGNGNQSDAMRQLLESYRRVLIANLSRQAFADMQAQTATYGLFAARCLQDNGQPFTRQTATFIPTTPFLQEVMYTTVGPKVDPRVSWIVDDIALLLERADMAKILHNFGSRTEQQDPIIHFYEDFLAAYDPELREQRGVYYTPRPVVTYIVRCVDQILQQHFDLPDGLATQIDDDNEVVILDPAAGTGTFLREAILLIRQTVHNRGLGGAWPEYVQRHLLPRLHGFELLIAPYVIGHLKIALELGDGDQSDRLSAGERLNMFLTNTLEPARESSDHGPLFFAHEIAKEAASANRVKMDTPVMVVIGNPPYSGHSANKGEWIRNLLRGKDGLSVTGSYFHVNGEKLNERNPKWLNDDYVKFIRFAQWRIERTGQGVIGFVTNHAYLDNPTFRGMRHSLLETFDEIYVLDLHGNARKKERSPDGSRDDNVFDIQQGIAVGLFIKYPDRRHPTAKLYHCDLWGSRHHKYSWLSNATFQQTQWQQITPQPPFYLFVPQSESRWHEYEQGWRLTDIFRQYSAGIVTARDSFTIRFTAKDIRRIVRDFTRLDVEEARRKYRLRKDVRDWKVHLAQKDVTDHPDPDQHVTPILYRPFDTRYTYYTGRTRGFHCMPRPAIMRSMANRPNRALISVRQVAEGVFNHVFAADELVDFRATFSSKGGAYVMPLHVAVPWDRNDQEVNLHREFMAALSEKTGLTFLEQENSGEIGPADAFHYIYAILHSPEYRRRYADLLKMDFPRIPVTSSAELFWRMVSLGNRLASLHLMEAVGSELPRFPCTGSNLVAHVPRHEPTLLGTPVNRVWINGQQYFEGITPETWDCVIAGYRPAQLWLKSRKNRTLSFDDIQHYQRLCAALAETNRIMTEIDPAISAHGGWPIR